MIFEIVSAPKSDLPTEEALIAALSREKKGFKVENIHSEGDNWVVRLAADDNLPPFMKKDEEDESKDEADADDPDADSDDDSEDSKDDTDDDKGGDKGDKPAKNPAAEVKGVIDQLTKLFTDLGGKVDELQAAHDEKADKLKDIGDTVGPDGHDGPPPGDVADIGPTPGGPPAPPMPDKGFDGRKKPIPGSPGGGLPTFTNYQVATHPGVDVNGNKLTLVAASSALQEDPEFVNYDVVGVTENSDGTFSAKLKLKTTE